MLSKWDFHGFCGIWRTCSAVQEFGVQFTSQLSQDSKSKGGCVIYGTMVYSLRDKCVRTELTNIPRFIMCLKNTKKTRNFNTDTFTCLVWLFQFHILMARFEVFSIRYTSHLILSSTSVKTSNTSATSDVFRVSSQGWRRRNYRWKTRKQSWLISVVCFECQERQILDGFPCRQEEITAKGKLQIIVGYIIQNKPLLLQIKRSHFLPAGLNCLSIKWVYEYIFL